MRVQLPLSPKTIQALKDRTRRDSLRAGAFHVLTSRRFASEHRVWRHVDSDFRIDFADMLAEGTWSSGERALLELAASLYGSSIQADVGRLLAVLGDSGREVAFGAVMAYLAAE